MIRPLRESDKERMSEKQLGNCFVDFVLYACCYVNDTNGIITNVETKDVRITPDGKFVLITDLKDENRN